MDATAYPRSAVVTDLRDAAGTQASTSSTPTSADGANQVSGLVRCALASLANVAISISAASSVVVGRSTRGLAPRVTRSPRVLLCPSRSGLESPIRAHIQALQNSYLRSITKERNDIYQPLGKGRLCRVTSPKTPILGARHIGRVTYSIMTSAIPEQCPRRPSGKLSGRWGNPSNWAALCRLTCVNPGRHDSGDAIEAVGQPVNRVLNHY